MKIFTCLFLGFNWQQQLQLAPDSCAATGLHVATSDNEVERNGKVLKVIETAGAVGQVGYLASEEEQQLMEEVSEDTFALSESKPARFPLTGEHKLIYSAAEGASSGRVFGNVVGKVSQLFEDDEIFYNRVNFGPLQISLRAKREIMNDSTIKVSFLETSFNLFGKTLKKGEVGGGGVWKVKFVGKVQGESGKEKLVRIMETPSLFVLEQDL
mmetsp:Transcript_10505/g.26495  ORF Transcript_10505/g.26495 Transcript_10505/m.26495 type:complete len:212 (-) Transcript_10505:81-716(-)